MAAEWVTLREASERCSVAVSTLRNWYRQEMIQTKETQTRYGPTKLVRLDEVEKLAGSIERPAPASEAATVALPTTTLAAALDAMAAAIRTITDQHVRLETAEAACRTAERVIEHLAGAKGVAPDLIAAESS